MQVPVEARGVGFSGVGSLGGCEPSDKGARN